MCSMCAMMLGPGVPVILQEVVKYHGRKSLPVQPV